jgi:hypothetical protein
MHSVGYEMLEQQFMDDKFAGCMLLQVLPVHTSLHQCMQEPDSISKPMHVQDIRK